MLTVEVSLYFVVTSEVRITTPTSPPPSVLGKLLVYSLSPKEGGLYV